MNVRSDAIDGRFRRVGERRIEGVAPAKVNLFLEVLGRRPDGYHELRTVFHEIDLCDELSLELLADGAGPPADALEASGRPIEGPPGANLVLRAVAAYRRRVPRCPPVRAALRKVVPPGSGTGGGSSDAAFVLGALQLLLAEPLDAAELRAVASEVGADVGFFLVGGTALGAGRGDELTPVETPHAFTFVVAFPSFSLSTARVYEHVDLIAPRVDVSSFLRAMRGSGGESPIAGCFNRLEAAAGKVEPLVLELLARLRGRTGSPWALTGSRSACFAPAADAQAATRIAEGVTGDSSLEVSIVRSFARRRGPVVR